VKREAKPKQPIIGISLEQWELNEVRAHCGGEEPGWVARQLLYKWILPMRDGTGEVPLRKDSLRRLPKLDVIDFPDTAPPGDASRPTPAPAEPQRPGRKVSGGHG